MNTSLAPHDHHLPSVSQDPTVRQGAVPGAILHPRARLFEGPRRAGHQLPVLPPPSAHQRQGFETQQVPADHEHQRPARCPGVCSEGLQGSVCRQSMCLAGSRSKLPSQRTEPRLR